MFGHPPFYFGTLRKLVVYFGTIFNDVNITRTDGTNTQSHLMRIPLQYGPKEKELARVKADPEIQRETAITLPRMSFQLNSMQYDGNRKLNTMGRIVRKDNENVNKFRRMYNPVPYNFFFTLSVYAKNVEDGSKIIEQITPFFTPEFTSTVNLIPEMDISIDIPIVLNSIQMEDTYEGSFDERRLIVWTLDFVMKGMLFAPIVSKPIIKFSNTDFYIGNTQTTNTQVASILVKPGLDSNGNPTTNNQITVPANTIDVDSNWDYIVLNQGLFFSNT